MLKPVILIPATDPSLAKETGTLALATAGLEADLLIIHDEQGKGYVWAVNEGLKKYQANHICLYNQDIQPMTPGWLLGLMTTMLGRKHAWFAGPSGGCRTYPQSGGRIGDQRQPRPVKHLSGFCLLANAKAIKMIPYLDDQFIHYAAEVDWQWKIARDFGKLSIWVPGIYVAHEIHDPIKEWWDHDQTLLKEKWRLVL